jgi:hypothetical protein
LDTNISTRLLLVSFLFIAFSCSSTKEHVGLAS